MHVLLVDDEENALDMLEILLNQIGNITIEGRCTNPLQAIHTIEAKAIDAIFLDIQMPGMIGLDFARIVKETSPHTQIIFTTAYAQYAVEAFEIDSLDYLLKPFTKERLQETIHRVQKRLPVSSNKAVNKIFIQCLGDFTIKSSDSRQHLIRWKTHKEKELCAFLIHHIGEPVETDRILDALWADYDIEKAKSYLYTCLSYLRKNLNTIGLKNNLIKTGKGYLFSVEGVTIDVLAFTQLANTIQSANHSIEEQYVEINNLFTGEYMERCDYRWSLSKKEDLSKLYIQTLRHCHLYFSNQEKHTLALDSLQRIFKLAPDSEQDAQQLMCLHCSFGNKKEAIKVYQQLEHTLCYELGIQLSETTKRLYQTLIYSEE